MEHVIVYYGNRINYLCFEHCLQFSSYLKKLKILPRVRSTFARDGSIIIIF